MTEPLEKKKNPYPMHRKSHICKDSIYVKYS